MFQVNQEQPIMNAQTIAVKCPQCGNSTNLEAQQSQFGYEFTCSFCGTTSVLVINRQLYVPTPGERVCAKCGRVAMRDARVCQCGAPLVRKCVNPKCLKEFPVNHQICDYCGWPQEVNPTSSDATEVKVRHAIRDLSDPDIKVREAACDEIKRIGAPASAAVPRLVEMLKNGEEPGYYKILETLGGIGASAAPAVPVLFEIIKANPDRDAFEVRVAAYEAIERIERQGQKRK